MQRQIPPLALLFSSLAYFYNSVNNVVSPGSLPFPLRGRIGMLNRSYTLVDTNYGVLRGIKAVSRNGRSFHSFRGDLFIFFFN